MRLCYCVIFLFVGIVVFAGCSDDSSEEPVAVIEDGDIYGTVSNKETGEPIGNASVSIGGQITSTGSDGKYILEGISCSDKIDVAVTAADFREYESSISLDQELMALDIQLVPEISPIAEILKVLEAVSQGIEALDPDEIPSIQSHLAEDYVAANDPVNDQVTLFGIIAGVIPPDYDGLPDTVTNIIEKNDELEFRFEDPDVEFNGDLALVLMRFEVYAETKPPDPQKWEIVVNGRLDLRKENGDWKITYWRLIPPFLKFEENPL